MGEIVRCENPNCGYCKPVREALVAGRIAGLKEALELARGLDCTSTPEGLDSRKYQMAQISMKSRIIERIRARISSLESPPPRPSQD